MARIVRPADLQGRAGSRRRFQCRWHVGAREDWKDPRLREEENFGAGVPRFDRL